MRGLKVCLWLAAVGCLLAGLWMFLPLSLFEKLGGYVGQIEVPASPVFLYCLRVLAATYFAVGLFYVILTLDPEKYGILVPFSAVAAAFVGIVCGITGLAVGMPVLWFLGDFLFCTVLGVLIFIFWHRSEKISEQQGP